MKQAEQPPSSRDIALAELIQASDHASEGRWNEAEAGFARALLCDASLHIARYQLGLLQFSSGRPALALVTWQPLVEQPVDPGLAAFVQGFRALSIDDFEEASTSFELGLAQDGVNPAVALDIRMVLERIHAAGMHAATAEPGARTEKLVANYGKL